MNNNGQMGFNWLMGLLVLVISLIFFSALYPTIIQMFGMNKGNMGANCGGYVDPQATTALGSGNNNSYNPAIGTDQLSCTIFGFGPALIVVSVIFGLVAGLISGKLGQQEQQPQYGGY